MHRARIARNILTLMLRGIFIINNNVQRKRPHASLAQPHTVELAATLFVCVSRLKRVFAVCGFEFIFSQCLHHFTNPQDTAINCTLQGKRTSKHVNITHNTQQICYFHPSNRCNIHSIHNLHCGKLSTRRPRRVWVLLFRARCTDGRRGAHAAAAAQLCNYFQPLELAQQNRDCTSHLSICTAKLCLAINHPSSQPACTSATRACTCVRKFAHCIDDAPRPATTATLLVVLPPLALALRLIDV